MTVTVFLNYVNVLASSVVVILAFSLLAYTLTYNFRNPVARRFVFILACVMLVFASDVALDRVVSVESAERWLRFQWLGIAMLPAAYYSFSLAVLAATNYRVQRRWWVNYAILAISVLCATDALFGNLIVDDIRFMPPISYLEAGPLFWVFALFFVVTFLLALMNIWHARARCLTEISRQRMTYLVVAFAAPGVAVFPYLVAVSRLTSASVQSGVLLLTVSIAGNIVVGLMLVLMAYTVAYFGVVTPDRVVRYRLLRFFMRGPVVAILVILAIQTVPRVERVLGLPRDVVLFSVIAGVVIFSQLFLSITKTFVDRLVYREDREEVAWLREIDRRLLTTSDLRQLLENNLIALCELLRVPSGFVAALIGPDLILEAVVGTPGTRDEVLAITDWTDAMDHSLTNLSASQPVNHCEFWIWPLVDGGGEEDPVHVLGILGVRSRTTTPLFTQSERRVLETLLERIAVALADRRLQQSMLASLRYFMPSIERMQLMRNVVPYAAIDSDREPVAALLDPSPIHSPEFEAWVKDALSHYWGGPKLTQSPLMKLRLVSDKLSHADDDPTKALRLVLGQAIDRLRPEGKQNFTAPEWLLYNILEMRFIQGRKVREIADRLAMSESDLYRKQRVAIGHLARVLSEMELENGAELLAAMDLAHVHEPAPNGAEQRA